MVELQSDGRYYSDEAKKYFADPGEAEMWEAYHIHENFVNTYYYKWKDLDTVYIHDQYLYERWLKYLTLLQCTIHPNLVKNYDIFEKIQEVPYDFPENQTDIPELFMKYKNDFKGPGWYSETSTFQPEVDKIGIAFKKANKCPLDQETLDEMETGWYKRRS